MSAMTSVCNVALVVSMLAMGTAVAMPPPEEPGSNIPAPRLDLLEAWRLAMAHDPVLRAEQARREATREVIAQSRSRLLPQIGLTAYREDARSDGERIGLTPGGIGTVSSRTDSDTDFIALQLRQPIIAVDRWVGTRQAGDIADAADLGLELARENLALRVAQTYFGVLAAEDGRRVAESHLLAVARFREQIGYRYEAGVVANTDLQEAQAAVDSATADAIDARHAVRLARQALADLIGRQPSSLRPVSSAMVPSMPEPSDPAWWMERASTDATPVRLAFLSTSVAAREIDRRKAAAYPTLDLVAARSRLDRSSTNPFETTDIDGTTLRLELNVPLFTGGAIRSSVRQAAAEHRAAGYLLDEVRQGTVSLAQRAWLGVEAAVQRIAAREQALRSVTVAGQAAEQGVVEGIRTTLDVLQAQRQLAQAQAALALARYEYVLAVFALRAATGLLDEVAVRQVNAWLD